MPDYGLKIRDASGAVTLNVDEKINRVRFIHEATATENDNTVLSDISGLLTVEMAFAINVTVATETPLQVTRSGTTIAWSPYSWSGYTKMASLIIVFIYV